MARLLIKVGQFTYHHALLIVLVTVSLVGVAAYGISQINVNDNPIVIG
jgi:predicted RND superfamily exporter protein